MQEGVVGVSFRASEPEIVVYVESEELVDKVPKTLLNYPVRVEVIGRVEVLSIPKGVIGASVLTGQSGDRTYRWRPICGGISIGSVNVTAGTLACRVYDRVTGRKLMLSNRHVFWGSVDTKILQPGKYDGGRDPDDVVGYIYRFVEVKPPPDTNLVDAALGVPISDDILSDEVLDVGVVTGVEDVYEGMVVGKSGRSTGYTTATVLDTHVSIKVYGYPFGYAVFEDQILTTYCADHGDSGSLMVNPVTKKAVGLVFAGSDKVTVANKISHVCNLLNISFIPTGVLTVSVPPYMMGLALLPIVGIGGFVVSNELYKYIPKTK